MSDYLSRNEIAPADRATATRAPAPITAVQHIGQRQAALDTPSNRIARLPAKGQLEGDQLASAAEYASVHERIASILAELRSSEQDAASAVDGANAAIQAMLPTPIIVVPLPPASKDQMEQAARLAKRMVEQAAFAHAAQNHVRPGTVDQILSMVV